MELVLRVWVRLGKSTYWWGETAANVVTRAPHLRATRSDDPWGVGSGVFKPRELQWSWYSVYIYGLGVMG